MDERVRLRPDLRVAVEAPDVLRIMLPTGGVWLFDVADAERLVAALSGDGLDPDEAPELVAELQAYSLVDTGLGEVDVALAAGAVPEWPRREGRVLLVGDGDGLMATRVAEALAAFGVPVARIDAWDEVDDLDDGDVVCVATDLWDVDALREANAWTLANGVPWVAVGPFDPRRFVVGPFVVPNETPCHRCWSDRRRANTWDPTGTASRAADPEPDRELWARFDGIARAAAGLAAADLARFRRGYVPLTLGSVWSMGAARFDAVLDRVWKAPRCPACGRTNGTPETEPWSPGPGVTASTQSL